MKNGNEIWDVLGDSRKRYRGPWAEIGRYWPGKEPIRLQDSLPCPLKKNIYVIYRLRVGPYGEKLWPRSWKYCPRPGLTPNKRLAIAQCTNSRLTKSFFSHKFGIDMSYLSTSLNISHYIAFLLIFYTTIVSHGLPFFLLRYSYYHYLL